jgi:hypothetical protein
MRKGWALVHVVATTKHYNTGWQRQGPLQGPKKRTKKRSVSRDVPCLQPIIMSGALRLMYNLHSDVWSMYGSNIGQWTSPLADRVHPLSRCS